MSTPERHESSTLGDYLRVLRRRKWVVILVALLAPAVAVALSLRQTPVYEASADVLLRYENLAGALAGVNDVSSRPDPARGAETQAILAATPPVAQRALEESGLTGLTPTELLDASSVEADPNADVLTFSVRNEDPQVAEQLASAYATAYTEYRQELDTGAIAKARTEAQARIDQLEASGDDTSALYTSLVDKVEQLSTLEALQTQNASVIRQADDANQVQPTPVRNGILAGVLGLLLGVGLAFLWEALDTRIRSTEEIQQRLGLPLLGRLPEPARRAKAKSMLLTLDEPSGSYAEAFRVLRTNLEFATLEEPAGMIMVTSAAASEGKSTTCANLAVTLAKAGRRVVLVDLDLRWPSLNMFFDREREPGLTDIVLGHVSLDEALEPIVLGSASPNGTTHNGGGTLSSQHGLLELLPSGPVPPEPSEFLASDALGDLLADLRRRAELVLIDTPPLLGIGDALALSARVDGLLLVTRLETVRRPMLKELRRVLDSCQAAKLGFVLCGGEDERSYGYTGYSRSRARTREEAGYVG